MTQELIPFAEVKQLAQATATSGFFPGVETPEKALVLMTIAQAEGCHPIQAMQRYHIIKGKPCKQAWAMLADFVAAGGSVEWIEHGPERVAAKFSHPQGGTITSDWTMKRAAEAGLRGDNWSRFPENMLHARCVSNGVKFVLPAAANGLYTPEEVMDFSDDRLPQQSTQASRTKAATDASKIWDKLPAANTEQPAPQQVKDAEYQDVPQGEQKPAKQPDTAPAEPPPEVLAMPGDDCDRVPTEIVHKSRKLNAKPFAEQTKAELAATVEELERLAKGAKVAANRAAIAVVATFARQALEKAA